MSTDTLSSSWLQRRGFLTLAGGGAALGMATPSLSIAAVDTGKVVFPPINAPTEAPMKPKPLPLPDNEKVGFALVGLGRLTMNQLLPAFGRSLYAKPVALVSGDRAKAQKVGKAYGIADTSIYGYDTYDRIADNPAVQVIYIVLPNSMHAEFTVRGARAGKHILCEKPMANSVAECQQMIDACRSAGKKLMVAYRSQYDPLHRAIVKMVKDRKLGDLKMFSSYNVQNQGAPDQWRHKLAMAGGGALPDIGLYCLNAARALSGEEPSQVMGQVWSTPNDPRFKEVEESVQFMLKFPSGLMAHCGSGYSGHESKALRLMGSLGWVELDPAFEYVGNKMRVGMVDDGKDAVAEPSIEEGDQFAHEIDHMARCVLDNREPLTPGAEGLQDQRIMEAIYKSAKEGRAVSLAQPAQPVRGPELAPGGED